MTRTRQRGKSDAGVGRLGYALLITAGVFWTVAAFCWLMAALTAFGVGH